MSATIAKAENFILKNARPLNYELYRFQRGQGSQGSVRMPSLPIKMQMVVLADRLSRIISVRIRCPSPAGSNHLSA